jgi:hypothetical protein
MEISYVARSCVTLRSMSLIVTFALGTRAFVASMTVGENRAGIHLGDTQRNSEQQKQSKLMHF